MTPAQPSLPDPSPVLDFVDSIVHAFRDNLFLLAVGIAVIVVVAMIRRGQKAIVRARDVKRVFTKPERMEMFARAGGRCEHKPLLGRRCTEKPTHGDHIYPWSKGGATTMDNAQALCARHNGIKSAWVPTWPYIKRLEHRRRSYFPEGVDPRVWWHQDSPPPWRV